MSGWITERIGPAPFIAVDRMGEGPLVVFLHGVGGNRTNWHDQLPVFARRYKAVTWDARGYGGSDDYAGPFDIAEVSHDLARVLDHYGAAKAHIVGLSMGGVIAQDFYFRYPHRAGTLTLCDTGPGIGETMSPAEIENFLALRLKPLREGKQPADIAAANARNLMSAKGSDALLGRLRDSLASVRRDSYMKALEAVVRHKLPGRIESIKVPTLIVCGREDKLTTPAVSESMHKRIPGSRLCLIADAGHLSNIEQPAAFDQAVLEFLAVHPLR